MKMTSDAGTGDAIVVTKKEVSDFDPNASPKKPDTTVSTGAVRSEAKNRLTTFSIDSLVGKKDARESNPRSEDVKPIRANSAESPTTAGEYRRGSLRSPSPPDKRHCPQLPPNQAAKMAALPRTPPANGVELTEQQQRFARQSAFVPPPVSSGSSASFVVPPTMSGPMAPPNRLCWDLASMESGAGLWKEAVTASAMYQAAAAAALYGGYHVPWYGHTVATAQPMSTVSEMAKKQQMLLQHEQHQQQQQSMAVLASPPDSMTRTAAAAAAAAAVDPRHHPSNHHHGQPPTASMMQGGGDQQSQTFWHHHIAELLRQNGGHPVHHSRLYAGADAAGHAAASFLFSGCRKPKRIRTAFSPNQLMELEAAFDKNQYVVGNERKDLARRLALTETQVKVWFQNRRTKAKRMKNEDPAGTPGAASTSSSTSSSTTAKPTTTISTASYHQQTEDGGRSVINRIGHGDKDTLEITVTDDGTPLDGRSCRAPSLSSDEREEENEDGFESDED